MRRGVAVERGGTGRNVTTPNCLIPGRAMRELIGNTGVHVVLCCTGARWAHSVPLGASLLDGRTSWAPLVREQARSSLWSRIYDGAGSARVIFNYRCGLACVLRHVTAGLAG